MTKPVAAAALRTAALTLVAVIAFAANSLLAKIALAGGAIDPGAFTLLRIASGAAALAAMVALSARGGRGAARAGGPASAAALLGYAACFSYAFVTLEAGIGSVLLFASVQITMLAGALIGGERPGALRWAGIAAACAGFAMTVAPGPAAPDPLGAALMIAAGASWGLYSIRGRAETAPLAATARNFALATPLAAPLLALVDWSAPITALGVALAAASGALASGAGYAVWYAALRGLDASVAAAAQLGAPLIAVGVSVAFLGEPATLRLAAAAVLTLGGVALAAAGGARRG